MYSQWVLLLFAAAVFSPCTQGRSVTSTSSSSGDEDESVTDTLWQPEEGSRQDWLLCGGMPCDVWERTQQKLAAIYELQQNDQATSVVAINQSSGQQNVTVVAPDPTYMVQNNHGSLDGCIMLTEEQADMILESLLARDAAKHEQPEESLSEPQHSRKKRKISDFDKFTYLKWKQFPIPYKFDGKYSETQKQIVRAAAAQWEEHTCIRFREAAADEDIAINHLLFTKEYTGCHSYVGMMPYIPQQINLMDVCFNEFGVPVHEIGHALGLWHEQMRFDRDDYVLIHEENLGFYSTQLIKMEDTVSLGVDYDYSSVMHYSPYDGTFNGQLVIEALDPLYQNAMGQRIGLSFADAHIINKAYCQDVCPYPLPRDCENNGYQDPNNCNQCRCPDGLSGRFCEEVAPSKNAQCGGQIQLLAGGVYEIKSPGYDSPGFYDNRQECSWMFEAPYDHTLRIHFEDSFSLYCHHQGECHHYVEVRANGNLGLLGPRFCCLDTPDVELVSIDNRMLVLFQADWDTFSQSSRRGFRAIIVAEPATGGPSGGGTRPTTTSTTTPTTTTSTTTTTTTTPTTTTPTTTTTTTSTSTTTTTTTSPTTTRRTNPGSGPFSWSCTFEGSRGEGAWCDMRQDRSGDDFDWTIQTGRTPSYETGPEAAYEGDFYIFIEASNPRRQGDMATIFLPNFQEEGYHCVKFHYHMWGFHINRLMLFVDRPDRERNMVWTRYKQQPNRWIYAEATVDLTHDSTIGFTSVRGGEFSGDIALDNIRVEAGACNDGGPNGLYDPVPQSAV